MTIRLPLSHPWAWALAGCILAAAGEAVLAGSEVGVRFSELHQPPFSPPLWAWAIIGGLYYALFFFLLKSLLAARQPQTLTRVALVLVFTLLAANAFWNWLFFREKDLWLSSIFYMPYGVVALALALVLFRLRSSMFYWYLLYVVYLAYAGWWGISLWRLNAGL